MKNNRSMNILDNCQVIKSNFHTCSKDIPAHLRSLGRLWLWEHRISAASSKVFVLHFGTVQSLLPVDLTDLPVSDSPSFQTFQYSVVLYILSGKNPFVILYIWANIMFQLCFGPLFVTQCNITVHRWTSTITLYWWVLARFKHCCPGSFPAFCPIFCPTLAGLAPVPAVIQNRNKWVKMIKEYWVFSSTLAKAK